MYRHDSCATDYYNRDGGSGDDDYPVFAVSSISIREAHTEIYTIFGKGTAIGGIWSSCYLLPEKCQLVYRKPWTAGSNFHSAGNRIAFVEKTNVDFYSRGNCVLYAFGAVYFLADFFLAIKAYFIYDNIRYTTDGSWH